MGKLYILILALFFSVSYSNGQAINLKSLDQSGDPKIEMQLKVDNFAFSTNNFLDKKISQTQFNQVMMNEEDIQYWAGQFNITENVTEEDIYNKLESIATEAKANLEFAFKGVDKIEVSESKISFGKDPRLKVNKAANIVVHLIKDGSVWKALNLTLVDIKGELKLIKAK